MKMSPLNSLVNRIDLNLFVRWIIVPLGSMASRWVFRKLCGVDKLDGKVSSSTQASHYSSTIFDIPYDVSCCNLANVGF